MKTPNVIHDSRSITTSYFPSQLSHFPSEQAGQQPTITDVPGRGQDISELNSLPCPFRTLLFLLANVVIYCQIKQCCSEPFELFCWIRRSELCICLFNVIPAL